MPIALLIFKTTVFFFTFYSVLFSTQGSIRTGDANWCIGNSKNGHICLVLIYKVNINFMPITLLMVWQFRKKVPLLLLTHGILMHSLFQRVGQNYASLAEEIIRSG